MARLVVITTVAMIAFAGNVVLCRIALSATEIDPASFTAIRIVSGAITLVLLVFASRRSWSVAGNWRSSLALFAYAGGFSFAYVSLSAATGALLLFGAVQCTMIGYGYFTGERMSRLQALGVIVAVAGVVGLLLPGLSAPPLVGSVLMLGAGIAWGIYSLRGRGVSDALLETCGNFVRAVPFALALSAISFRDSVFDISGVGYAVGSGALASGIGYAVWYTAMRGLTSTSAATVQLSVPALAAAGGTLFLGEPISIRLVLASVAILGGIAIYILSRGGVIGAQQHVEGDN
jgi:drug/metabolite transporter (DMT)-like permease